MNNISFRRDGVTLVNVLAFEPANQVNLLSLLQTNIDQVISTLDGWISTSLLAAADGAKVVIVSQWRDGNAVKAMQADARMQAYFPQIAALARFDSVLTTVAHMHAA